MNVTLEILRIHSFVKRPTLHKLLIEKYTKSDNKYHIANQYFDLYPFSAILSSELCLTKLDFISVTVEFELKILSVGEACIRLIFD